jgi:L-iditol 2-dehydrogenase
VKALQLCGPRDLRLEEGPMPVARPGEVLLRVAAVGLCGSDRHWFEEGAIGDAVLSRPLVLGHEIAATVEAGPRSGERVVLDPADPCGRCAQCRGGLEHLCPEGRFAGHGTTDGGLCTFLAWPEHLVHRVPDALADGEAALLEPLGVALHALDLGALAPGASAAVFGCGPLGLLLVQLLVRSGCPVFAVDPLAHRLAAATALGAGTTPFEADVAFEVAGDDGALDGALAAVRPGGRVVLVGIPDGDRTTFSASAARRKGLTLLVSRRMTRHDLARAIELVEQGSISLAGLVTERHGLFDADAAFAALVARSGIKVLIEPQA